LGDKFLQTINRLPPHLTDLTFEGVKYLVRCPIYHLPESLMQLTLGRETYDRLIDTPLSPALTIHHGGLIWMKPG